MKKLFIIIIIPYMIVVAGIFYFFFGPGLMDKYRPLEWKGIEAAVPASFKVKTFNNRGWQVYNLGKLGVYINIAVAQPAVDVSTLPADGRRVLYRFTPGPGSIYYVANPRKTFEVVFACTMEDTALYFSVSSASVFSASTILDKITAGSFYNGRPIAAPKPSIPLKAYITDFIFLGGMLLPLLIISIVFYLSAKKPPSTYFAGDPIRCEENFVYFSGGSRFRKKNSLCYLALTTSRLMVFTFGKLSWEVRLHEEKPGIEIQGKKIIIRKEKEKIVLKPSEIEKWREALAAYTNVHVTDK